MIPPSTIGNHFQYLLYLSFLIPLLLPLSSLMWSQEIHLEDKQMGWGGFKWASKDKTKPQLLKTSYCDGNSLTNRYSSTHYCVLFFQSWLQNIDKYQVKCSLPHLESFHKSVVIVLQVFIFLELIIILEQTPLGFDYIETIGEFNSNH